MIPTSVSATNAHIPSTFSFASVLSFLELAVANIVNVQAVGTYNISATYCQPETVDVMNSKSLHFLVHGAARDRHYWNGYDFAGIPYQGSEYSWVQRASTAGYPTLAIDRLGNGFSSHPNPNTTVQLPTQVEINHAIVLAVKSGFLGQKFDDITYVGHSYGSLIGQVYAAKYPGDIQRLILTGWSSLSFLQLLAGSSTNSSAPARFANPVRFGNLSDGYVATTNPSFDGNQTYYGYGTSFAGAYYDGYIPPYTFANRGTSTVGEAYSEVFISAPSPQYTGKVLAVTGQNDAFWCGMFSEANCGTGAASTVARGAIVFPNAQSYDYIVPANTGHEWNFHYTAPDSYRQIFAWLSR
jgi:pimeloyl-ACP methyl ester carboxylesterase